MVLPVTMNSIHSHIQICMLLVQTKWVSQNGRLESVKLESRTLLYWNPEPCYIGTQNPVIIESKTLLYWNPEPCYIEMQSPVSQEPRTLLYWNPEPCYNGPRTLLY